MKRTIALGMVLALSILAGACDKNPPVPPKTEVADSSATAANPSLDTAGLPRFAADSAHRHVAAQVAFGPRNPGSSGHARALEYLSATLAKYADTVVEQSFTQPGYDGEKLSLTNIAATFNRAVPYRILLVAHWDTRPRADQEKDSSKAGRPIVGANDGGSGVGVLLELARILKEHPPEVGIDILLVDGEDYGRESDIDNYFLGARYFAKNLPAGFKPAFGVLLDMIGDENARFPRENYSVQYAAGVVNALWDAAHRMGLKYFEDRSDAAIQDDHLPLNEAGIPTIDIIDASLVGNSNSDPRRHYWHTHDDTIDKVSPTTLDAVGRLMVYMIYRLAPAAAKGNPA